jgi:hypothetical protein
MRPAFPVALAFALTASGCSADATERPQTADDTPEGAPSTVDRDRQAAPPPSPRTPATSPDAAPSPGSPEARGTCSEGVFARLRNAGEFGPAIGTTDSFRNPKPLEPGTYAITRRTDERLTLQSGDGAIVAVDWFGPPLSSVFDEGETVTVVAPGSVREFTRVRGRRAEIGWLVRRGFVAPTESALAPDGEALELATGCTLPDAASADRRCGERAKDVVVFDVVYREARVGFGSTVERAIDREGGTLSNVHTVALPFYRAQSGASACSVEGAFVQKLTWLRRGGVASPHANATP